MKIASKKKLRNPLTMTFLYIDLDLDIIYLAQFTNLHSLLSYKTYINCLGDPKMCP